MEPQLILVVDDAEPTLILLHQVLVHLGHSVVLATGRAEAVALAAQHHPGIILLDVAIPGEDVEETLRALRRDGWAATTPIIAVTENGDDGAALPAQFAGSVRKPIVMRSLVSALEQSLASRVAPSTRNDGDLATELPIPG